MAASGSDARHPVDASSPNQIEEHRLHRVIPMVRHHNVVSPQILAKFLKVIISEKTRRHLDAYLVVFRIFLCCEVGYVQRDASLFAKCLTEMFIPVGLLSPHMKIAMDTFQLEPQFPQRHQQCHTVSPTRQRHQIFSLTPEQMVSVRICDNLV